MDDALKAMGQKIYAARKAAKMSRAELGKLVDLHETTVKRYEDGDITSPNFSKIQAFAEALHLDSRDLVNTSIVGKADEDDEHTYIIFRPVDEEDFHDWQKLMDLYWSLTDEGQNKVIDYVTDLAGHPNYKRKEKIPGRFKFNEMP
jgi:transcriptional regulator with XRE-family HTH domain